MANSLSIDVFNSGYKPIPGGPGWDDSAPVIWPARTSTLTSGQRDAILVDALLTTSEGERLAVWLRKCLLAAAVMTAAAAWGGEADG